MELERSVQRFEIIEAATFLWFLRTRNMEIQFSIFWPWLLHERGVSVLFHLTTVLENVNFSCFCFYFIFCSISSIFSEQKKKNAIVWGFYVLHKPFSMTYEKVFNCDGYYYYFFFAIADMCVIWSGNLCISIYI